MIEAKQLRPPRGWFNAVKTRDAEARVRDGHPFYLANELDSGAGQVFEVQFADGHWMLATLDDLSWATLPRDR